MATTGGFNNTGALPKTSGIINLGSSTMPTGQRVNATQGTTPGLGTTPISLGTNPGILHPKVTAPVTKQITTNPDGSSTATHYDTSKPDTATLLSNTIKNNQANYGSNHDNQLDSIANAQRVLSQGQQIPMEKYAEQAVTNAGQMSPQESVANANVGRANAQLKAYQNVQSLSPYAETQNYTGQAPTPGQVQNIEQAPDLVGRASGTNALLGSLGNIYGTSDVAGANAALQGTQTAAQRALSGAQSNLGATQTTAQRGVNTAENVLGASLVSPTTPGQAPFSGLAGYGTAGNQFGNPNDPATAANYQSYIKAVSDNNNIGIASHAFDTNFAKANVDAQQVLPTLSTQYQQTPIETLLGYIANGTLGNNPALSGLVNDINAIKTSYKNATGNDLVLPPTATLDQLSSIQSSAKSAIQAAQQANQKLIDKYSNNSSTSGSNNSGSFTEGQKSGDDSLIYKGGKWIVNT